MQLSTPTLLLFLNDGGRVNGAVTEREERLGGSMEGGAKTSSSSSLSLEPSSSVRESLQILFLRF